MRRGASAKTAEGAGSWDQETDIVVVGTGAAGVASAMTALEAGSAVIMIEKEKTTGGITGVCEQYCAFDSSLHLPQNFDDVTDSAELMLEDAMRVSNGTADEALAKIYCDSAEKQNRMLEILQFKLDILWSMLDAMTMAYALQRPPYHTVTDKAAWHTTRLV